MSRTDPQFNLRIPAELKGRIEEAAQQNKRSATAEIIARLESTILDSSGQEGWRFFAQGKQRASDLLDFTTLDLDSLLRELGRSLDQRDDTSIIRQIRQDISRVERIRDLLPDYIENLARIEDRKRLRDARPENRQGSATQHFDSAESEVTELIAALEDLHEQQSEILRKLSRLKG